VASGPTSAKLSPPWVKPLVTPLDESGRTIEIKRKGNRRRVKTTNLPRQWVLTGGPGHVGVTVRQSRQVRRGSERDLYGGCCCGGGRNGFQGVSGIGDVSSFKTQGSHLTTTHKGLCSSPTGPLLRGDHRSFIKRYINEILTLHWNKRERKSKVQRTFYFFCITGSTDKRSQQKCIDIPAFIVWFPLRMFAGWAFFKNILYVTTSSHTRYPTFSFYLSKI